MSEPDAHQFGLVHKMKPPERDLGSGQPGLRQFDFAIQSGIDTLGLDLDQSVNEASLLIERGDLLVHRDQLDIVGCGIQDDLLPRVFQLELRRQQCRASRADIVRLGKGIGQRVCGDAVNRRLAYGETVRVAQAGADGEAGLVGVHAFHHRSFGVLHVGRADAHLRAVAQSQVDRGVEGDPWARALVDASRVTIPSTTNWQARLTNILN